MAGVDVYIGEERTMHTITLKDENTGEMATVQSEEFTLDDIQRLLATLTGVKVVEREVVPAGLPTQYEQYKQAFPLNDPRD